MKNIISTNNLLIAYAGNLLHAERQWQNTTENNLMKVYTPEFRKLSEYPLRQSGTKNNLADDRVNKFERTTLHIKNMVSLRCKIVVKAVLENLGLHYTNVELGEVEIAGSLSEQKREQLASALLKFGLELIDDKKSVLVERIKNIIIEMIHYTDELPKIKFSNYLSEKLGLDYTYLSNLFTMVKGVSIEHFIIAHKIERVKELLVYEELTLEEIAWKLHYSGKAHLASQFKKVTGLTTTHFKEMKPKRLIALENV